MGSVEAELPLGMPEGNRAKKRERMREKERERQRDRETKRQREQSEQENMSQTGGDSYSCERVGGCMPHDCDEGCAPSH